MVITGKPTTQLPVIMASVETVELSNGNQVYRVTGWYAVDYGWDLGVFAEEIEALRVAFVLGVPVVKVGLSVVAQGAINRAEREKWIRIIETGIVHGN
jgi:hypothetical protein